MNLAVKDYYYFKYGFNGVRYDAKEFIITLYLYTKSKQ